MNRILSAVLVIAALAAPATAFAEERFLVVTSVRAGGSSSSSSSKLLVLTGATAAGNVRRQYRLDHLVSDDRLDVCKQLAIIAMNKPGKWFLDVESRPHDEAADLAYCTLVRNDPPPAQ